MDGPGHVDLEGFSSWYDEKQGDTGDLWHRTLIDPGLFALLGELPPGTRVLDLGCGNGYISRRLARAGAKVVGVDRSHELIARAREREAAEPLGISYYESDAAKLPDLPGATMDVAVANMSIMDIEDDEGALRETARLVRAGGRFVLSLSHPCFDVDRRSGWAVLGDGTAEGASLVYRKITDYRRPHAETYLWTLEGRRLAETVGYHRPLSWYAQALRRTGWVIVDMVEPSPLPGFSSERMPSEWVERVAPLHLVIEARREP